MDRGKCQIWVESSMILVRSWTRYQEWCQTFKWISKGTLLPLIFQIKMWILLNSQAILIAKASISLLVHNSSFKILKISNMLMMMKKEKSFLLNKSETLLIVTQLSSMKKSKEMNRIVLFAWTSLRMESWSRL